MNLIFVALISFHCVSRATALACLRNQFQCSNGDCIAMRHRCDRYPKCADRSDESGCDERSCPDDEHYCDRGKCVPASSVCDGRKDCRDNSDEEDCAPSVGSCLKNQFRCGDGGCVWNRFRCDNRYRPDCDDSSDESGCDANECDGDHRCGNGQCVSKSWVCDGEKDCRDSSDEGIECHSCETFRCPEFCNDTSLGPICYCKEGFEVDTKDNKTCKDMNECEKGGLCDQLCYNNIGSYYCWCHGGYELVNGTCRILDYDDGELVLYNEGTDVYFKILRTKTGRETIHPLRVSFANMTITGLSFDVTDQILYVSDANGPAIFSVSVSSLRKQELVGDRIGCPVDIAFDWSSHNLYWIDYEKGTAEVVSVDNLRRTVLVEDFPRPHALALSPHAGLMFIATEGFDTSVFMYGMDGRNGRILDSVQGWALSLALHPSESLLYWTDPGEGTISYVNYSSPSPPKILKRGISGVMSVAVSDRKVHYTFNGPPVAERVHWANLPGHDRETGWRSVTLGTKSLGKSECLINNGGCGYLCLTSELGVSCACPSEMILDKDGKSCLC